MKNAPVRHALEYALFRGLTAVVRTLPHAAARSMGRGLARSLGWAVRGEKRLGLANLRLALPELSAADHLRIVNSCLEHFTGYYLEVLSAFRFQLDDLAARCEVTGLEHLDEVVTAGRPVLLTAGHYGCWELGAYGLRHHLGALHGVARRMDNPRIQDYLSRARARLGIQVYDKKGAARRCLTALRRGQPVAMVIDQHVRKTAGIQVPFFDRLAWTSPVLAILSIAADAPVLHLRCVPRPRGRYELEIRPAIEPTGSGRAAEAELTRRYMAEVEKDVRREPSLWIWTHRRWRE